MCAYNPESQVPSLLDVLALGTVRAAVLCHVKHVDRGSLRQACRELRQQVSLLPRSNSIDQQVLQPVRSTHSVFATDLQLDRDADRLRLKMPCNAEDCLQLAFVLHRTQRRPKRLLISWDSCCYEGMPRVLAEPDVAGVLGQVLEVDMESMPLSKDLGEVGGYFSMPVQASPPCLPSQQPRQAACCNINCSGDSIPQDPTSISNSVPGVICSTSQAGVSVTHAHLQALLCNFRRVTSLTVSAAAAASDAWDMLPQLASLTALTLNWRPGNTQLSISAWQAL
jgi:hypothetical protein